MCAEKGVGGGASLLGLDICAVRAGAHAGLDALSDEANLK